MNQRIFGTAIVATFLLAGAEYSTAQTTAQTTVQSTAQMLPQATAPVAASPAPAPQTPPTAVRTAPLVSAPPKPVISEKQADLKTDFLAYAQAQMTLTNASHARSYGHGDFRLRRARLGYRAEYLDQYSLYLELEGAPADATGASGTALSEARINIELPEKYFQFRAGKFKNPLSGENMRASYALDTIERSIILNSLMGSKNYDEQIGFGFFGDVDLPFEFTNRFTYGVAVFNGNNAATPDGNKRDDNENKEFVAKVQYETFSNLKFGLGYSRKIATSSLLTIRSLSSAPFLQDIPYAGQVKTYESDVSWVLGPVTLAGEMLYTQFGSALSLQGGMANATYLLWGNREDGLDLVTRFEAAKLTGPGRAGSNGDRIQALTLGANTYLNRHMRFSLDYIHHDTNGPGNSGFAGRRTEEVVLAQLQAKF